MPFALRCGPVRRPLGLKLPKAGCAPPRESRSARSTHSVICAATRITPAFYLDGSDYGPQANSPGAPIHRGASRMGRALWRAAHARSKLAHRGAAGRHHRIPGSGRTALVGGAFARSSLRGAGRPVGGVILLTTLTEASA